MDNATVQDQAQQNTEERKPSRVKGYLTSPWVLLCPLVLIGGMWLVTHPEIVTSNIDKPYALLAGPALVGSVLVGWLFVTFFKAIASWCQAAVKAFLAWRKQDGSTFWLVIVTFLAVSVLESGSFFNILLGPLSLYDSLGYAAALVNDLVAVECMRARLAAVRMRDANGARLYLLGVVACASLSAFANVYSSLLHFQEPTHTLIPWIMIKAAPWIGMAFPLLIVFLSFAADYTADQTSSRLDPEQYEASEKKRIRLLEIQRDQLRHRVDIEHELDKLNAKLGHKKERRTFFLVKLLFPKDVNMDALKEQLAEEQKQVSQQQQEAMQKQLDTFFTNAQNAYNNLASLVEKQAQSIASIDAQRDTDNALMMEQIRESQQTMQAQITDAIATLSQAIKTSEATTEKAGYTTAYKPAKTPFINVEAGQGKEVLKSKDKASYTGIANTDEYPVISQSDVQDTEEPINGSINLSALTSEELPSDLPQDIAEVVKTYPQVYFEWIAKDVKSVDIDSIVEVTGQPKRRVQYHAGKTFTRTPKNPKLYTVTSVIKWLRTAPSVSGSTDELSVVIPASNGNHNGHAQNVKTGDLEELTA